MKPDTIQNFSNKLKNIITKIDMNLKDIAVIEGIFELGLMNEIGEYSEDTLKIRTNSEEKSWCTIS